MTSSAPWIASAQLQGRDSMTNRLQILQMISNFLVNSPIQKIGRDQGPR